MLNYLREALKNGPVQGSIMAVGGNTQVSIKVEIIEVDEIGMVCRSKGMMGGWGDVHVRPWSCIATVSI